MCMQEREGTFKFEDRLIEILLTKVRVSPKQQEAGIHQQNLERTAQSQPRAALAFLRGSQKAESYRNTHSDLMLLWPSGLLELPLTKQNSEAKGTR